MVSKYKRAFTLVELLVVISIIALLLSILMPSLSKAREQAKRIVCATNLRSINLVFLTYAASNDGKYPRGKDWFSGATSMGYFHVFNYGDWRQFVKPYIDNGDMFYCPSGGAWDHEWIKDASHPKGWDGIDQSGAAIGMFSYSLWPSDGLYGIPSYDALNFERPDGYVLSDKDLSRPSSQVMGQDFAWSDFGQSLPGVLNHPKATTDHLPQDASKSSGFNNMYYDGHVKWRHYRDAEIMAQTHDGGLKWFR